MFKVGMQVEINVPDFGVMVGHIDRVIKMDGPCNPTDDQTKWSYHVQVNSNHPRNSGIFQIKAENITKVLQE